MNYLAQLKRWAEARKGLVAAIMAAVLALVVIGFVAAAGGGPERSTASLCGFINDKINEVGQSAQASGNPLAALIEALGTADQRKAFLDEAAQRAPDDIQPTVQQLADTAGQSGGGVTKFVGYTTAGLWIAEHCSLGSSSPTAAPTQSPTPTDTPSDGSTPTDPSATPSDTPTDSPTPSPTPTVPYTGAKELPKGTQMGVQCEGGTVTLSAVNPVDNTVQQLASVNVQTGDWTDVTIDCTARTTFSGDFTKAVFYGKRANQSETHIGYIDLTTGVATDLTAARQGSSFGSTLLSESSPMFIGRSGGAVDHGSDTVAFEDTDNAYSQTSLSNPALAKKVGEDKPSYPVHPEAVTSNDGVTFNPSETLAVDSQDSDGVPQVRAFTAGVSPAVVSCSSLGTSTKLVGWLDDTHAAFTSDDASYQISNLVVVTIDPRSLAMQCSKNLLPASNRNPTGFQVVPGGKSISFSASSNSSDGDTFQVSATGGEPTSYTPPSADLPSGLVYWSR